MEWRALVLGCAIWGGAIAQSWCRPFYALIASLFLTCCALALGRKRAVVALAAVALGASLLSFRQFSLESSIVKKYVERTVELHVQVITDPHRMAEHVYGSAKAPTSYSFLANVVEVDHRFRTRIPVRVISHESDFLPGQTLMGSFRLIQSKERRVAALAIARSLTPQTQASRWARGLAAIRMGLRETSGRGDAGSLIPGMVLGDTSLQSDAFQSQMRRSGLTHLVAVSGANFAIVSTFVLWAMAFLFSRKRTRLMATALALLCFIALVRPSPSVLRAAAMAAVMMYATAAARKHDSLPALGFAIAAVVVIDPWQSRDPGFALSVLATAGLLLLAPRIKGPIAEPVAAMVFCSPVIIAISGFISPMSIIANVLAAPVVAPITVMGFVAALISPLAPQLSTLLIALVKPLAWWIVKVADVASGFSVISIATVTFLIISLALLVIYRSFGKAVAIGALCLILVSSYFTRFPSGEWDVVQCDVGHGDALVLSTLHRKFIVIDTGPDPVKIDRCLAKLHIKEVALVIITHPHADHDGGLSGVMKSREVGAIWRDVAAGTTASIDGTRISVLWPRDRAMNFRALPGDGSAVNNTSIAVVIDRGDFTLFAAGDLEPPAQAQLSPPQVDIYKVSHHGSRYQDEAFTRQLSPRIALISVGEGNSYGHPAPETLTLLRSTGARVERTDRAGAIALDVDGRRITVRNSTSGFRLWRWI